MNTLRLIHARTKARSLGYNAVRILNIYKRYGLSNEKVRKILIQFVTDIQRYNIQPTFPVTASVVRRTPTLFQSLEQCGVEFALHGFKHIDYTQLAIENVHRHWEQGLAIFKQCGLRNHGFRFPFLRRDPLCLNTLNSHAFLWDSSDVISWPLPKTLLIPQKRVSDYQSILETYQVKDARENVSLPYFIKSLVEIPVSMLDDDILVERLGFGVEQIDSVWQSIFEETYKRKEMFVLQLHPERYLECKMSLLRLIKKISKMTDVWTPTLSELALWWSERTKAIDSIQIKRIDGKNYQAITNAADRVTLIIYNNVKGKEDSMFSDEWKPVPSAYRIVSRVKPVIGIVPECISKYVDFFNQEGYLFEEKQPDTRYAIEIDHRSSDSPVVEFQSYLNSAKGPLLRVWRWPRGIRSVFAVTGDIDGLDFWDYWIRFYGN
ncbi:polysaccharide deacetylase family protein [bacterium]|nr:polysaccharide deacetylase family protein [candidate division CSSED10-310 bacterium]